MEDFRILNLDPYNNSTGSASLRNIYILQFLGLLTEVEHGLGHLHGAGARGEGGGHGGS